MGYVSVVLEAIQKAVIVEQVALLKLAYIVVTLTLRNVCIFQIYK